MATKKAKKPVKTLKQPTKRTTKKPAAVPFLARLRAHRFTPLIAISLFALVGAYFVFFSSAMAPNDILLPDQPDRGVVYNGQKVKATGPCKDNFDTTTAAEKAAHGKDFHKCEHIDPGPEGVNVHQRELTIDKQFQDLAAADATTPDIASDAPPSADAITAATITNSNMDGIGQRDQPCIGTGSDGRRVTLLYVYAAGSTNRISTLRPGFVTIAKRMNSIMYQSGYDSGNAHQIRFETTASCVLVIRSAAVPGSVIPTYASLTNYLQSVGYTRNDRKYVVWVDYPTTYECGRGSVYSDTRPTLDNYNNTLTGMAAIWRGCWNYGEPHELMHMLGAVQPGAPYSTPGYHCRDKRDVMCYNDGTLGTLTMVSRCTSDIAWWRYDCGHDTYYRGNSPATGYLSNHWNTANNNFLTR